jgi:alginate O-acetyltransferase complex protein AlgI
VYRKELKPIHHIVDYAFFVSFFPQLVAGPIVRASDFLPQVRKPTFISAEMLGRGVFLIACGLFKKAIISDYISLNYVDRIFDNPTLYSGVENLIGLYGYALQIYCDFSGYSDMAIGIALLLGYEFNINFNSPYQSSSITEFWRRWHISLSTWLRDYLYISLGGNRKGRIRTYINLLITMLLGGLWHGAAFRFIVWGALHGIALALDKFIKERIKLPNTNAIRVLGMFFTFHFVCFAWIFFRAADMTVAAQMINQILFEFNPLLFFQIVWGYPLVIALMILGYFLHLLPKSLENLGQNEVSRIPLIGKAALLVIVILLVIQVKSSEIQPFIYFQF